MQKAILFSLLSILCLSATACDKGLAYGDPNAVIVVAPEEWFPDLRDSMDVVLSPDVFTLRPERTFRITYQAPVGVEWQRLKKFKKEILIGSPEDPWIAEALATLNDTVTYEVPGMVETEDVWARNQLVTIVLVDPTRDVAPQVFPMLDQIHAVMDQRFRRGVVERMFVSGVKQDLADSLMNAAGFSLLLPDVYRYEVQDPVHIFRNDNPDPAELIRQIAVVWRTPIPDEPMPVDSLMGWKEALSQEYYAYPQAVDRENLRTQNLTMGTMAITEVRGAWSNPPDSNWPAAGPFLFWAVACPAQNRLYALDAWAYAPGKDKWEYVLQLETILESFRCGAGGG